MSDHSTTVTGPRFGRLRRVGGALGVNRTVFALSAARLGDAVGNSILFVVMPLYVGSLPAPWFPFSAPVRVGALISLFGLTSAACSPLMGWAADRTGRPKLLVQAGLALMGVATIGYVLADRFVWLIALRGMQGMGVALSIPPMLALLAMATRRETRGRAMGFLTSTRMAGIALGPLLGGVLVTHLGFDSAFYTGGALVLSAIALVYFWVDEPGAPGAGRAEADTAPGREPGRAGDSAAKPAAAPVRSGVRNAILPDLRSATPGVLGAALATGVMIIAFTIMTPLEEQFNERLSQTPFWFGLEFSALILSRLALQIPLGWVSDRLGRKPVIIGGLLLLAPATALLGVAMTPLGVIGLRVVQGAASAGIAAPAFALAADSSPAGSEGRQMSFITLGFSLGIAIGPLAAGLLALASFELPFLIGGLLAVVAAWVIFQFVPETVHPHTEARPEHA